MFGLIKQYYIDFIRDSETYGDTPQDPIMRALLIPYTLATIWNYRGFGKLDPLPVMIIDLTCCITITPLLPTVIGPTIFVYGTLKETLSEARPTKIVSLCARALSLPIQFLCTHTNTEEVYMNLSDLAETLKEKGTEQGETILSQVLSVYLAFIAHPKVQEKQEDMRHWYKNLRRYSAKEELLYALRMSWQLGQMIHKKAQSLGGKTT